MNGLINKGVSSALARVFSRRAAILKIAKEKALGTRLLVTTVRDKDNMSLQVKKLKTKSLSRTGENKEETASKVKVLREKQSQWTKITLLFLMYRSFEHVQQCLVLLRKTLQTEILTAIPGENRCILNHRETVPL